ncbi:hypothetical protein BKA70DRAFT_1258198 [Coprinopsis sp. MPI-PUGE-AT-0042]|nr:hypothetical protein BKA70DRAFT_1258198 [Coprinopsis sp. MPI-PUGE-AT-0042]
MLMHGQWEGLHVSLHSPLLAFAFLVSSNPFQILKDVSYTLLWPIVVLFERCVHHGMFSFSFSHYLGISVE